MSERPFNIIGAPRRRVDGRAKVTGQTIFADDIFLPRMLHCKLLRSPHPHARIESLDASRAVAHPGVHLVLTGKVRNQGSKTVRGASIEVHFLNAVNEVLDIRHVAVGDLAPGEVKAFWGRGSHYDNINNLDDVRFIPRGNW